jgi:large subunit ribosomal protein L17e
MTHPCHVELILTEGEEVVQKTTQIISRESTRLSSRQRGVQMRRAITEG